MQERNRLKERAILSGIGIVAWIGILQLLLQAKREIPKKEFQGMVYDQASELKQRLNQLVALLEKANVLEDLGFNIKFFYDDEKGGVFYETVEDNAMGFDTQNVRDND